MSSTAELSFRNFDVDEQNQAYVTIVEINGDNNSYKAEVDDWIDLNEMIKPAVIESGQGMYFLYLGRGIILHHQIQTELRSHLW